MYKMRNVFWKYLIFFKATRCPTGHESQVCGTLSSPSTSDRFLLFLWFMKQQVCGSKYYFILNWRSRVWVPLATESPLLGSLTSQCGAFWRESRFSWAPRGYRTPGGNPPAPPKKKLLPLLFVHCGHVYEMWGLQSANAMDEDLSPSNYRKDAQLALLVSKGRLTVIRNLFRSLGYDFVILLNPIK